MRVKTVLYLLVSFYALTACAGDDLVPDPDNLMSEVGRFLSPESSALLQCVNKTVGLNTGNGCSNQKSIVLNGNKPLENQLKVYSCRQAGSAATSLKIVGTGNPKPLLSQEFMEMLIDRTPKLQSLTIEGMNVPDNALARFSEIRRLKALAIDRSELSSRGFENICGATNLESLRLVHIEGVPLEFPHIRDLTHLTELDLELPRLGVNAIREISALRQLKKLRLAGMALSESAMGFVSTMPIRSLEIAPSRLEGQSGRKLRVMPQLEHLSISSRMCTI